MSEVDSLKYFRKYVVNIPKRCDHILNYSSCPVQPCPWNRSAIRSCLLHISEWIVDVCRLRKMTRPEIHIAARDFPEPIKSSVMQDLNSDPWVLNNKSNSLCTDCCILYMEMYRAVNPEAFWTIGRNKSDYFAYVPHLSIGNGKRHFPVAIHGIVCDIKKGKKLDVNLYQEFLDISK